MNVSNIFEYGKKYHGKTYEEVSKDKKYAELIRGRRHPEVIRFIDWYDSMQKTILVEITDSPSKHQDTQIRDLPPPTVTDWSGQLPVHNFSHIVHISDTHIRLEPAQFEKYDFVFNQLLYALQKLQADNINAIVVVTGDILHHPNILTAECIDRTFQYFQGIAAIFPTVLIAGNHDCSMANKQALDSIYAVFFRRNPPGMFYAQERGRYRANNILFSVLSRVGKERNMSIPWEHCDDVQIQVLLYYGPVEGAMRADGTPSHEQDRAFRKLSEFSGYDLVLLGDYHTYQHPEGNSHVAYVGSMICQNFGEVQHPHGFLIWDVGLKTAIHTSLLNEYDLVLIDLDNNEFTFSGRKEKGSLGDIAALLPAKGKFRMIHSSGFDAGKIQEFRDQLEKIFPDISQEWRLAQTVLTESAEICHSLETYNHSLSSIIRQFLVSQSKAIGIKQERQDPLIEELDQLLRTEDIIKATNNTSNIDLLEVRWSNVLTYGDNNVIDFQSLPHKGIVSLNAPNSSGKSSMVDIIIFSLFGEFGRGHLEKMTNNHKHNMSTTAIFKLNPDTFCITRTAHRNKVTGATREHHTFFKKGDQNLTGPSKKATERTIREILGSPDNFKRMCICFQQPPEPPLMVLSSTERRNYLSNFHTVDLTNMYEYFYHKANEIEKKLRAIKDNFSRESRSSTERKMEDLTLKLGAVETQAQRSKETGQQLRKTIEELDESMSGCRSVPVVMGHLEQERKKIGREPSLSKEALLQKLSQLTLLEKEEQISRNHFDLHQRVMEELAATSPNDQILVAKLNQISELKQKVSDLDFQTRNLGNSRGKASLQERQNWLGSLEQELSTIRIHSSIAGKLQYNKDCNCCNSNEAHLATSLSDAARIHQLEGCIRDTQCQIQILHDVEETIVGHREETYRIRDEIAFIEEEVNKRRKEIQVAVESRLQTADEYQALCKEKTSAEMIRNDLRALDAIESIQVLEKELAEALKVDGRRKQKFELQSKLLEAEEFLRTSLKESGQLETLLCTCRQRIAEVECLTTQLSELGLEATLYNKLKDVTRPDTGALAVHIMDGHFLPHLEQLVNCLLSTVLQRRVKIKAEGVKSIGISFISPQGDETSTLGGMEQLMHDIAFRIALSKLALVPRYNLLIIDEGVSVLDKTRLSNIDTLFDFLRSIFHHTIVITHLEGITDHVDRRLTIEKDGKGFSSLRASEI